MFEMGNKLERRLFAVIRMLTPNMENSLLKLI